MRAAFFVCPAHTEKAAGSFTGTDRIVNIYVNNQKVNSE
jgi:hypothetical protein